jgi:hypothetical protein
MVVMRVFIVFSYLDQVCYSPPLEPESEPLRPFSSWSIDWISPVTGSSAATGGEYEAAGVAESEAFGDAGASDVATVGTGVGVGATALAAAVGTGALGCAPWLAPWRPQATATMPTIRSVPTSLAAELV